EVSVSVAPVEGAPSTNLVVNMPQARAYVDVARRVGDHLKIGGALALQWLLEQPGVISREEQTPLSTEEGWPLLHDGLAKALARVRSHMGEFARLLDEGGAVGRTLDFLIQEMNREVNTVGSKADDLELSQAAIAAKSTLEKLREQVQNIE